MMILLSHPSWVCGLKLLISHLVVVLVDVTSFVGVWIETLILKEPKAGFLRHILRGCVD